MQAYIAAMPGWKSDVGRRLDALIVRTVPGVRKAVKWNSPIYGMEGEGWFLGVPLSSPSTSRWPSSAARRCDQSRPAQSKHKEVRYLDIHEDEELDEAQFASWVKQASRVARRTNVSGGRATTIVKKATTTMKQTNSSSKEATAGDSPSQLIDARIKELGDWRGETLARIRSLIKQADPEVVEEWKWRGVPVWSHAGIICTGETYKNAVKMTFAKGAALEDPSGLFNSSLEGNTRRAIDFHEGDKIDERALESLVRAAVDHNQIQRKKKASAGARAKASESNET